MGIISTHPVSSGTPTDNKGDILHVKHNSSKYFLILRLAQKWPVSGKNKVLAVTRRNCQHSILQTVIQHVCHMLVLPETCFLSFSLHIPTYLHILWVFYDEIRTLN